MPFQQIIRKPFSVIGLIVAISGVLSSETATYSQDVEGMMLEFNKKCGPLSGKTPSQMSRNEYAYCEGLANKANQAFGLPGPGFEVRKYNLPCVGFMGGGPEMPVGSQTCHPAGIIAICTGAPGTTDPTHGQWNLTKEKCSNDDE